MVDIASLAIKIDTSDVAKGEQALDKLATAGAKAEKAADGVGDAWKSAGDGLARAGSAAGAASSGINQSGEAARKQAEFLKKAGLSAGQYNNAMRMMPMQLTDVVTSLSSGMPLWQVAIQQGGQVRDSFGGIGNAAKAVAGAIPPATAAIGGLAAVAAALLVAYQQGQNEAQAYSKALILSGNAAGTSADELTGMAQAIDGVAGTQRNAAQALAEVAGTGKFAADQIQGIATAAIQMEQATGKAVSDTVKEFARLADEPAAASAKLNEQYNYLTASVYEQITALEQQGNTVEAARVATEAYANAVQQRAGDINTNLGTLERAWRGITGAAAEAWDAMLNVGREDTLEQQLADAYEQAQRLRNKGRLNFDDEFNLAEQERRAEYLQGMIAQRSAGAMGEGQESRINQAAIDAQQEVARIRAQSLSKAEQKEKEIAAYRANLEKIRAENPASPLLDKELVARDLAYIDEKYKEVQAKQKAFSDDAATRLLLQLRGQEASLQAQLAGNDKLSAAQQAQVQFAQQIADLKEKRILTAEQKSLLANQDVIAAQLAQNVALDEQLRKREQANELERLRIDILRSSGQKEAANAAQFELDYARQRLEYERAGNVEALARLETLKKLREIEAQYSVKPGTVEGVSQAPDAGGISPIVGGASSEMIRLEQERMEVENWRVLELERQKAYLDAKAINEEVYAERVANIHEQSQIELSQIEDSMLSMRLGTAESLFGDMAAMAKTAAGEQSALYKVMFAAQKAFAIAQTIVNAEMASAAAMAPPPIGLGPVAGLPYSQLIRGMGYASAAMIGAQALMGMAHDGIDSVPKEGTWLLDKGERVVDSRTNSDLKRYLSASDAKSGGPTSVQVINNGAPARARTEMDGNTMRIILDEVERDFAGKMSTGTGRYSRVIEGTYGMQRQGR